MAQRKLKAKASVPNTVKNKKHGKQGNAVTKRANRPIQSKKKGITEAKKIKQVIKKTVNKSVEEEIRSRASNESSKSLSKAQQAVAEHNLKSGPSGAK